MRISDKDGIHGTIQDQYTRINGKEVLIGMCAVCRAQCYASSAITLKEVTGETHICKSIAQ